MSAEPSTSAKKPFGNGSIKNAAIPQPRSRTHLKVMDETPYNGLIEGLRARLGPHGVLTGPADTAPYCEDWRRLYHGRTSAVLRPATTAGGNNTARYGNARDLVLGLEVVLPDGQVWNGLRRLHKDNTGYCLRQLFVGSEGTLGIITAAVLKLYPRPRETAVALCALASPEAALDLFNRFQQHDAAAIQAYEYMSRAGIDLVLRYIPGTALPIATTAEQYALIELATPREGAGLRGSLEEVLAAAMEAGVVLDAVIAESGAQRAALWKLREEHSEAQKLAGASVKNDVSVPVSKVPELIRRATDICERLVPGIRCVPFGHLGDGNIHLNLVQPEDADPVAFLARDHELMDAVNEIVRALDGSFSAEHGIGKLKPYMMPEWRGGAELELMRRIKAALDPKGLLNPGKLLP